MNDFLKPTIRRQPDKLVIHVGTNDIRRSAPQDIADKVSEMTQSLNKDQEKQE